MQTAVNENDLPIVWDLSDRSFFATGVWFYGQVQVNNRQVQLSAIKAGGGEGGWAAVDDIAEVSLGEGESCATVPVDAVTPTLPPQTTPKPGTLQYSNR